MSKLDKTTLVQDIKIFIAENFLGGAEKNDLADDVRLLDTGIIDSVSMLMLINHLEDTFGIEFDVEDIDRDRFNTFDSIAQQVLAKAGE